MVIDMNKEDLIKNGRAKIQRIADDLTEVFVNEVNSIYDKAYSEAYEQAEKDSREDYEEDLDELRDLKVKFSRLKDRLSDVFYEDDD